MIMKPSLILFSALFLFQSQSGVALSPLLLQPCCAKSRTTRTYRINLHQGSARQKMSRLDLSSENEDDGWGDASGPSLDDKAVELRQLQNQRDQSLSSSSSSRRQFTPTASNNNNEPERDLFIPIFAVVSLVGLFGSYGYEMLRLYSRGELYLPWNN